MHLVCRSGGAVLDAACRADRIFPAISTVDAPSGFGKNARGDMGLAPVRAVAAAAGEQEQRVGEGPRRTQEEKSRETRRGIVEAAIAIIGEGGFSRMTTPAVARRAGVSRGALQYHFNSKEDLVSEAVYVISYRVNEDLGFERFAALPLAQRVSSVIDTYWSLYGSELFLSALEIVITSRFDRSFTTKLGDKFFGTLSSRDEEWIELFADTPLSVAERVTLRRLTLDVMRGMAMRVIISNRRSVENEVDLLKQIVLKRFEDALQS